MVSNKNNKIFIIIAAALPISIFVFFVVIAFALYLFDDYKINKNLKKTLNTYEHAKNVVYYDDYYICFNQNYLYYDYDTRLCWIDDYNIVLYNSRSSEFKTYNETEKTFKYEGNSSMMCSCSYYDGSNIVYKDSKDYFCYNISANKTNSISQNEFSAIRDGGKYIVDMQKSKIKITNCNSGDEHIITKDDICKNEKLHSIYNLNRFLINDYRVVNDFIYIQLFYHGYGIVVSFDIINKHIDFYDWNNNPSRYYDTSPSFYIFKDDFPASMNKYYIH